MRKFLHKVLNYLVPSRGNAYRPHLLKKQWLLFFLTMVLTAEGVFVGSTLLKQSGIEFLAAVVPGEVIAFTNVERIGEGLSLTAEHALLSKAAQAKAEDMAKNGYFAHVGPDGKEPWAWIGEAGYLYRYAGENLAVRFVESKDVVEAWMASPSHRANIVKPMYTDIGVGVAEGLYEGRPATFVVQYFGAPREAIVASAAPAVPVVDLDTGEEIPPQTTSEPAVQGVTASAAADQSVPQVIRTFFEGVLKADSAALWLIGGIAGLLIITLVLAFVIHLQVQPTDMLMGGATVAIIAISLFAINTFYIPSTLMEHQSAAVGLAGENQGGVIDARAVDTYKPW